MRDIILHKFMVIHVSRRYFSLHWDIYRLVDALDSILK